MASMGAIYQRWSPRSLQSLLAPLRWTLAKAVLISGCTESYRHHCKVTFCHMAKPFNVGLKILIPQPSLNLVP
jgi:hypothetical protein